MKKILLFFALISASSVLAQPAKVLICAPGNLNAAKTTDSSLRKFYSGSIDLSDTLTDVINNYEAVFLIIPWHQLSLGEGSHLHQYLRSHNRLYIEYGLGTYSSFIYNNLDSSGFWKDVGIMSVGDESIEASIQYVTGVKGTFAEGLNAINSKYYPGISDVPEVIKLYGNITTVLYSDSTLHLAYTYKTDSFKVVLHWRTIPDYYDAFLGRVICNYFELCAPLSVDKKLPEQSAASLHLYPNPATDVLNIQYDAPYVSPLNIDIVSSTGSIVGKRNFDQSANGNFTLSLTDGRMPSLSSGTYFLRLTTNKEMLSVPFYLNSK